MCWHIENDFTIEPTLLQSWVYVCVHMPVCVHANVCIHVGCACGSQKSTSGVTIQVPFTLLLRQGHTDLKLAK